MATDFFCKVVLQPENEIRCETCYAHHITGLTYELTNLDDYDEEHPPKVVGTFNLKSTNRKGVYLLEVPFHDSKVTYELIVTEKCY